MNLCYLFRAAEFANIPKEDTGLKYHLRISGKEPFHRPRLNVFHGPINALSISMTIEDNPKQVSGKRGIISPMELQKISEWIIKNKRLLLDYWYNSSTISTLQFLNSLKPV